MWSLHDQLIWVCFLNASELKHGQQGRFHTEHGTAANVSIMPAQRFCIVYKATHIVSHILSY